MLKTLTFIGLVAAGLVLVRLGMTDGANLFPDEALYAWLGHSAPLNFCPHPPGTPLLTRAGVALVGRHEFGARFGSFLLGILTLIPLYRMGERLGGRACARWTVLAYACTPFFVAFGAITTPDGPQLFCMVVALYCTWEALQGNRKRWWVAAGGALAVGLYFKYIIIFYFPSLLLALFLVPEWRRYLRTPGPYLAGLVVLVFFLAVAAWIESRTGWPTIRYHLKDRQVASGFSLTAGAVYHGIHLGYYSPLLYLVALWAMGKALVKGRRENDRRLLFLAAFAMVPWLFFAAIALFTRRDLSREQWDACAYLPAYLAAGILLPERSQRWGWMRVAAPVLGAITLAILTLEIRTAAVTRLIDREPLFSKISGWRILHLGAQRRIEEHFGAEERPFILADSFAPALELAFYSGNKYPIYSLPGDRNSRYGLNEVLEQTGVSTDHLRKETGRNGLLLLESTAPRGTVTSATQAISEMFEQVEELRRIPAFRKDRQIRVFRAFKGTNLQEPKATPTR